MLSTANDNKHPECSTKLIGERGVEIWVWHHNPDTAFPTQEKKSGDVSLLRRNDMGFAIVLRAEEVLQLAELVVNAWNRQLTEQSEIRSR